MSEDDKYTYPGSGGVLVNSKGIRNVARLDAAMNDYASAAMAELRTEPTPDRLDYNYLRGIHTRLFERIVPGIAGKHRDVDVQATGVGIPYCRPAYIEPELTRLFDQLGREDYLTELDADTFAARLADRWGELSAIHPYRDGNTRSQSLYVTVLAERAGHPIDWQRIDVDALRTARLHAVVGNSKPLADYLGPRLLTSDAPRQNPSLSSTAHISSALRASYPQAATDVTRSTPPAGGIQGRGSAPYMPGARYGNDLGEGR